MDKIKILHVIGALGIGGCEKQLLQLCKRLDTARFELSLIWYSYMPGFKDSAYAMEDAFKQAGVQTIHFDKFSMPLWKFIMQLRNAIKHIGPDIVHTWMYSANFWGRWVALSCDVPCMIASYRVEVKDGIENNPITRWSEKFLTKRTLRLANSRAVAKSLDKFYGIPESDIRIVYNAISNELCSAKNARSDIRQELGLSDQQKIVLMVASQKKQKNYPLFIRTAQHICHKRSDITFVGVGRGDRMEELNILIDQNKLKGKVLFVGQRNDVERWLAAADIFCLTSDFEGFANAILEAMMAGLPVVSTNFSGIEEIINNSSTGIVVPLNDDITMAAEIMRVIDNPALAQQLGTAAKSFITKHFTWDKLISTMESIYDGLAHKASYPKVL